MDDDQVKTSGPARWAMIVVRAYQVVISPHLPNSCRYSPTCSEYALQALARHGLIKGVALITWRILRCHPLSKGGYDPVPGSLKAALNVAGNALWPGLAAELNFDYDRGGDYVVAVGQDELPALDALLERGRRNGVTGLTIISSEEMRRREPQITPAVSGALYADTGGVCAPFGVTIAAAENAVMNGVTLLLETAFEDFVLFCQDPARQLRGCPFGTAGNFGSQDQPKSFLLGLFQHFRVGYDAEKCLPKPGQRLDQSRIP